MPKSKSVLVTGCAKGIGRAIAEEFASHGWEVIGIDVTPLQDVKAVSRAFQGDVSDPHQITDIARQMTSLDCLVNNAALQIEKSLLDTTVEEWNDVIAVNLNAAFYLIKALSPLLHGGSIVNISSVHAKATSPGLAAYVASKGGLSAFTRAAALELASVGIRVNSILPGAIETEMLQSGLSRFPEPQAARERLMSRTPLRRIGLPHEVAKLTYFLAEASLSGNITGQEFACDGGVLARLASE